MSQKIHGSLFINCEFPQKSGAQISIQKGFDNGSIDISVHSGSGNASLTNEQAILFADALRFFSGVGSVKP